MGITLLFDPRNEKQAQAMRLWADRQTEEILYGGSKNSGKSYLGVNAIFGNALLYADTRYFIARATLNDLTKQTTGTISKVFQDWGLDISRYAPFNGQQNVYNCYNGSKVFLLGCDFRPSDPMYEGFGSYQHTQGWIEEAGEVTGSAKTHLGLSIGRWNNDKYKLKRKMLITCNPKKGWLKDQFIDPFEAGRLPDNKAVVLSTVYDNVHREEGSEKVLEDLTGVDRERLLHGNWNYSEDDDTLISGERIVDLYTNSFVKGTEKYITADIAREGKDKTVIMIWQGLTLVDIRVMLKNRIDEAASEITRFIDIYQVPLSNVIVDQDGVGGGVVDALRCKGFVNNSTPLITTRINEKGNMVPDNFDNLKSQCYYCLANRINAADMFIKVDLSSLFYGSEKSVKEALNQELENVRRKNVDTDGKLGVMPKEKVKQKIGRSPDYSDAMMMRMYFEVSPNPYYGVA